MNASAAIASILKAEGTEYLFCFPVNPLIDDCARLGIRPIVARTERAPVNMADGYAQASCGRRIGVAAVQHGPGAASGPPGPDTADPAAAPRETVVTGRGSRSGEGEGPFQHTESEPLEMKWTGLAHMLLALILVAGPVSAGSQPAEKVYGVGIVGNCCTHGAGLCALFQGRKDTRVVAAFEPDPRGARELAATWGRELSRSYGAVIRDPAVDVVVISCDPCDKADMVEKAAAAGRAIFLNKPACDSLDAARRIAAAVRRHHVTLVHDIPMIRSEPAFARLREEVRARPYGKILGYHHLFGMNFDPSFDLEGTWPERLDPPSKSGGGELTNMGCYAIDYAVGLLGRPRAVLAKTRKEWVVYRRADVENFGQIVLDYGDIFAMLEAGKQQLPAPSRHANALTITFEHRAIHVDATARQVSLNHVPQDWDTFIRGARAVGSADRLIRALRDGISAGDDVGTIVDATEVLMAAYESSLQGGRPIALPLPRGDNPLNRSRRATRASTESRR